MKFIWFKKAGWVFLPVHWMGFLVTMLAILFMIPVCIAIARNGHSASDDLYRIFVYASCTGFWWKWVAEKTCKDE